MDTNQIIIALISGLAGVIVGAVIQIITDYQLGKKIARKEYIQLCIKEWIKFGDEVNQLIISPSKNNNTIFRQNLLIKIELLSYIGNTKSTKNKVEQLKSKLKKEDENISLDNYAEECLNIGQVEENKTLLVRNIHTLVDTVLTTLKDI